MNKSRAYGYELVIDLHNCNPDTFNRQTLSKFFSELCDLIDMEMCEIHFWDDVGVPLSEQQTDPHTKGTSAVCFILTSTIVVHTLDLLRTVYVNIFSCKEYDPLLAAEFTKKTFQGEIVNSTHLDRQ